MLVAKPLSDGIGKQAVMNHRLWMPHRLPWGEAKPSVREAGNGHHLAEGANLGALRALLQYRAGHVKCTCIDLPDNAGEQKWTHRDRVSSRTTVA